MAHPLYLFGRVIEFLSSLVFEFLSSLVFARPQDLKKLTYSRTTSRLLLLTWSLTALALTATESLTAAEALSATLLEALAHFFLLLLILSILFFSQDALQCFFLSCLALLHLLHHGLAVEVLWLTAAFHHLLHALLLLLLLSSEVFLQFLVLLVVYTELFLQTVGLTCSHLFWVEFTTLTLSLSLSLHLSHHAQRHYHCCNSKNQFLHNSYGF